jgi:hypothetical protein
LNEVIATNSGQSGSPAWHCQGGLSQSPEVGDSLLFPLDAYLILAKVSTSCPPQSGLKAIYLHEMQFHKFKQGPFPTSFIHLNRLIRVQEPNLSLCCLLSLAALIV